MLLPAQASWCRRLVVALAVFSLGEWAAWAADGDPPRPAAAGEAILTTEPAGPVSGDAVIRGPAGGSEIVITTTSRVAGAIHSLTWGGREFIDSFDHGRQLQSASNFEIDGEFFNETFNPTEAGSERDGAGPTSTSRLLRLSATDGELSTVSRMAFWLRPGQRSGGHPAKNTTALSDHVLVKRVRIGAPHLPLPAREHAIRYQVEFHLPEGERHTRGTFEALTGYMPAAFSRFEVLGADGSLAPLDDGPGEQPWPVVFSTMDGVHAMGAWSPDACRTTGKPPGYGRFRFEQAGVTKWNCVFREAAPAGGQLGVGPYRYEMWVAVGTREQVRDVLTELRSRSGGPVKQSPDHPGLAIYREHCGRCHGEHGGGTKDLPDPLVGDLSVNQLAAYIDETMPEDDPSKVTGDAARQVAEYIHAAFYSPVARDRNRPARVELSRLTVRQHRNTVADLVASFRNRGPGVDARRGLRGEYFHGRDFDRGKSLVSEQIDPQVNFHFGVEGPDPERFEPNRFAIRWTGSIVPPETGDYEFVVRTEHSARLAVNRAWYEPPLIDAYVKSGAESEYRASIFLLGGRAYPLRLEFSKANQGVDNKKHEPLTDASIELLWRPPHGLLEPVPERCLLPHDAADVFVLGTPFPPDDKSIGYERGTTVSPEWYAATTSAAIETADYCLAHVEHLAGVKRDAGDRAEKLRRFATTFAERAFRRPLTAEQAALVIDRPFADAPDLDTALRRSILLVLGSPRFLFREAVAGADDAFGTAARLSFGLWDSIPDQPLWDAAAKRQLSTPEPVRRQAERMVADRRTRAKLRDFLFAWLRLDLAPEITKDAREFSAFSPEVAADLRTSLELFVDDVAWTSGDYRRLFIDDEVYVNGRLAALYGVKLPADHPFRRVRLDAGRRAGVLSHPYMMSVLAYAGATSPIHRGVFLARTVLGNTLKPPQEAVAPLAPDEHPELTTRERVSLQTKAVACQTCHTMINPLGFALEEFDTIGRYRTSEVRAGVARPIDASGSYQPRQGPEARFRDARELAVYVAASRDAQEAFVQALFHALVKQPARAWGPDTLERLRRSFEAGGFSIPGLVVDMMSVAALPPQVDPAPAVVPETKP